jgi:hypothetical protein
VSHQCLRESWALHSDYYSTTKKTASGLKKRVSARSLGIAARLAAATRPSRVDVARDIVPASRRDSDESKKPLRIGHFIHVRKFVHNAPDAA